MKKANTKKPKKAKVVPKKKAPTSQLKSQQITIKVQSVPPKITETDLQPEQTDGGKYMIPKTWLSEPQVLKMTQRTPKQFVYSRPAKGGGTWSYVTGTYIEKVLNFVFGWNWSFTVIDKGREQDQIWVQGRLTVKSPDSKKVIHKEQFGRAEIKYKRGSKDMLDYGNDLKAATTDSLKKCASMLGIASDIYGKMEFKQETNQEIPPQLPTIQEAPSQPIQPKAGQVVGPDGRPVYKCSDGDEIINEAEYQYSMKIFKIPLCRTHQKDHASKK